MVNERAASRPSWDGGAWIVEDEPAAATLAADLCAASGLPVSIYPLPLPFLTALRSAPPPAVVILDWRLEHELSAGLFLATRHRYPRLPVIYWTGSQASALPGMIQEDACTMVVDKASGVASFERALAWALAEAHDPTREDRPAG